MFTDSRDLGMPGRQCTPAISTAQEVSALQQTPQGDLFVVYVTAENLAHRFPAFAASQTAFDRWFKHQVQETTGADLNAPPSGPLGTILADTVA